MNNISDKPLAPGEAIALPPKARRRLSASKASTDQAALNLQNTDAAGDPVERGAGSVEAAVPLGRRSVNAEAQASEDLRERAGAGVGSVDQPAPRRRRVAAAVKAEPDPVASKPAPVGGFVGLWLALIGRPDGAPVRGDAGLTLAFIACIAVGTGLCFVGGSSVPFAKQIGFAGPLLATLAYPIWGVAMGAATRPSLRERLADNAYYLGFIFTQVALLVGFLPAAFGTAELSADQIIRCFGVALGASLLGLIARTILIQMSYTLDEAADVVSGEVSSLARQVSEQTTLVLDHFETLVARLAVTSAKLNAELQSGMTSLVGTVTSYNAALQADAAILHAGVTNASDVARRTASEVEKQQAQLADNVRGVADAIGRLQSSLESHLRSSSDAIRATTTALEAEVKHSTAGVRSTTEAVQKGLESLTAVSKLQDGIAMLDLGIGVVSDRITSIDGRVVEAGSSLDASLKSLDAQLQETRASTLERTAAINSEANEAVAALERTLQSFRAELDRLRA